MTPPEADQLSAEKRALREAVRARVASISLADAASRSRAICLAIAATGSFARARTIMAYLPIVAEGAPPEVDPRPLGAMALARGKRLCYPRIDWDAKTMQPVAVTSTSPDVEVRKHHVPEPVDGTPIALAEVDMVIVPGVAFDAQRHRLGRGGGFYDRFLAAWRAARSAAPGVALGIGFAEQIVEAVPHGTHDIRLDGIASDVGIWLG